MKRSRPPPEIAIGAALAAVAAAALIAISTTVEQEPGPLRFQTIDALTERLRDVAEEYAIATVGEPRCRGSEYDRTCRFRLVTTQGLEGDGAYRVTSDVRGCWEASGLRAPLGAYLPATLRGCVDGG